MKVKIYIVTYKNPMHLDANLRSLHNMNFEIPDLDTFEVTIINNHSGFEMHDDFKDTVSVMHNVVRPDFSIGHISRDWNAAIIHGFQDLNNPDCDLLIHCQDDTVWQPNALSQIVEASKTYSSIMLGNGDCLVAHTPDSIRRIGLWDERFSCNGFHELDYFLRAALYNGEKTSINDVWHQLLPGVRNRFPHNPYLWNPLPAGPTDIIWRPDDNVDRQENKSKYRVFQHIAREVFIDKWGVYPELEPLKNQVERHKVAGPPGKSYIMYPYFEKNVETLLAQNYLIVEPYDWLFGKY